MKHYLLALIVGIASLASGCVSQTVKSTSVPPLDRPAQTIPDDELLDIGVAILNPGIDSLRDDDQVFPEVRRAEATFIANELTKTLQDVGAWGAVRVVPDDQQFTDLLVTGRIVHSDGEHLELAIRANDARGMIWIEKTYAGATSKYAYEGRHANAQDPFLMVYRQIANDLLRVLSAQKRSDRLAIRQVAELRFARAFASDAFSDYLSQDKNGVYRIQRLPAVNDPMLERVRNLRQRNYVFVDTLQGYYTGFAEEMYSPYQDWRKLSYEEVIALRELQREANTRLIAGAAAVVAGIAAQGSSDQYARTAGMVGIGAGGYLLKSGLEKRAESNIHTLAIEELGQSLEAEITPRVIELEDRTVRLTGSVDDQYAQWRELMADIYAAEIGALAPPTGGSVVEGLDDVTFSDTSQRDSTSP